MYKRSVYALVLIFIAVSAFMPSADVPRLFLIGDSTMADKPLVDNPERGWGQVFPMFFDRSVTIENHAKNGRSTKNFIKEGRWQIVLDRLQNGDYVFIQFGHNDEKKEDSTRFADPQTDYRKNLLKFVQETRAKNANPVLLTPVSRRRFDNEGKAVETHHEYSEVVRAIAKEEQVPLIDLDAKSIAMFGQAGVEASKKLFLWVPAGKYKALPNGKQDNTHFTFAGAIKVADLVVSGIKELHLPIERLLRTSDPQPDVGKNKVVLLDYFFNSEWKADTSGRPYRYHYVWEDTANSGYSELGKAIIRLGAEIDTLNIAPVKESLTHASMYIIVDPDTPAETPQPHYIDENAIKVIVDWVRSGGILVLLGNDKGNAEFEHFNKLSENFGIHFNEDSRNRVQGRDFEMGSFLALPEHPLFKGVKKIYIKELSTLRISEPATSVLTDRGDAIMSYAKFGSGAVFAVGDPWLYNEYFDNRKLPAGFENYKAADNLFEWLLKNARTVREN
jgi:lysophospholipase L1-like esterase